MKFIMFKKYLFGFLSLGLVFALVLSPVLMSQAAVGDIFLYAGGGSQDNSPALNALINTPRGLAYDSLGNLYIAEISGHRIRKIDNISGNISTVAGTGRAGVDGDGGLAVNARLNLPGDVAFDAADNMYIVDSSNRRIRKVDAVTGIITSIAGTGNLTPFSPDGTLAIAANVFNPQGLAVDAAGNVFIAIQAEQRVRRVDVITGLISTVAGNGGFSTSGDGGLATAASMKSPDDVVFDSLGNMFISELNGHVIRRVDGVTGIITTYAGTGVSGFSGDSGLATSAQLNVPGQLAFDSNDNLYISDLFNRRVRRVDAISGNISTVTGTGVIGFSGDGGLATAAEIALPFGLVFDTSDHLFFSDGLNLRVRRIDAISGIITSFAGSDSGNGSLATEALVTGNSTINFEDDGSLLLAESASIRRIDGNTKIITNAYGTGNAGYTGDGGLATAADISISATDRRDNGDIYITDRINHVLRKIEASTGIITTVAGTGVAGFSGDGGAAIIAQISFPTCLDVASNGDIYICDGFNRIRKIDAISGFISTVVGNGGFGYNGDGILATVASLFVPNSVQVDDLGNIYVADGLNDRIRYVDASSGLISTIVGTGVRGFSGDGGLATSAQISIPRYLLIQDDGSFYLSSGGNHRVRFIDDLGNISTLVGVGPDPLSPESGSSGGDGGLANAAELNFPVGLALDSIGDLYIYENGIIRRVQLVPELGRSQRRVVVVEEIEVEDSVDDVDQVFSEIEIEGQVDEARGGEAFEGDRHGSSEISSLVSLLDLIKKIKKLFQWRFPDDYQLLNDFGQKKANIDRILLKRKTHRLIGTEVMKQLGFETFEFEYIYQEEELIEIVVDLMKTAMLRYGWTCYDREILEEILDEDLRAVGIEWRDGYVRFMSSWMDEVMEMIGLEEYVFWEKTDRIDILEAIELFLFRHCEVNELSNRELHNALGT